MWYFFFFKQKTAYEMLRSLVGSEMCIRDRAPNDGWILGRTGVMLHWNGNIWQVVSSPQNVWFCLLYTSDAADDLLCVDLGGRRIIKKKQQSIHR